MQGFGKHDTVIMHKTEIAGNLGLVAGVVVTKQTNKGKVLQRW